MFLLDTELKAKFLIESRKGCFNKKLYKFESKEDHKFSKIRQVLVGVKTRNMINIIK